MPYLLLLLALATAPAAAAVDPGWTTPVAPFQIADNLYYVGSEDLASYLVTTPEGNILINANLSSSPPQIRASVEKLGFRWADTKLLLNSQAHDDHVGGAAEVLRQTQAQDLVMEGDADVMESGGRTGFIPGLPAFAPARVDRVLRDGDTVRLGGVTLTAHKTAGHTRGCTTWTLRSHLPGEPAGKLRDIVVVGGVGFWSQYRLVDAPGHPASYPGIADDFRHSFATLRKLPCDVFLGAHGGYFGLDAKRARFARIGPKAFIDPAGYRAFVAAARGKFETALREQGAASPK